MFANPCCIGALHISIPMGTISKSSYDAFKTYIVLFLCNKAFYIAFGIVVLLYVCVVLSHERAFPPMLSHVIMLPNNNLYLLSKFVHEVLDFCIIIRSGTPHAFSDIHLEICNVYLDITWTWMDANYKFSHNVNDLR